MPAKDDADSEVSTPAAADEGSTVLVDRPSKKNDLPSAEEASNETTADVTVSINAVTPTESGRSNSYGVVPFSLTKFDVLQFKNSFLEIVEEVRMRRIIDAENEERIKQLVTENHDLHQKLEDECNRSNSLIEGHSHQENQIRKEYEEKFKLIQIEKEKNDVSLECWEQELKALKEETRRLHLVRYTLETQVQEQERQLQLQASSRDSYLSKIKQLEEDCSVTISRMEGITEQLERLEANVKGTQELHKKLEYVNQHQKCELILSKKQLEECRGELTETRVELAVLQGKEENRNICEEHATKLRATEQDLRMQVEINKQVQNQLLKMREEHRAVLLQLKEAHTLIDRHVESSARMGASEMLIQEELSIVREKFEESEQLLLSSTTAYQSLKERFDKETEELRTKCEDNECCLKALQSDYSDLQSSYSTLAETNSAIETEMKAKIEELTTEKEKSLKLLQEASERRKLSDEQGWRDKVEQFRSALEQSEALLAEKERSLQDKTKECSQLELQLRGQRQFLNTSVITPECNHLHQDAVQVSTNDREIATDKELEDVSKTVACFDDELSIQQIPELIISPDILPSTPPRRHFKSEIAMCMSKMSESKKVSPKLCLQRLPLMLQVKQPVEKQQAGSVPLDNEFTSSKKLSGEEELESPRKKRRIESPGDKQGETDANAVSLQENETRSPCTKQLKAINPHPAFEQLIEIIRGEETPPCDGKSKLESAANMIAEVYSADKPDPDMIEDVKDCANVFSKQPEVNEMDEQLLPCSPILSSDDGFELRDEEDEMMNTQISKQIDKVQVFLKMDRLRKTRKQ